MTSSTTLTPGRSRLSIDTTRMTEVPLEDRTRLLSDNGSGYVTRAIRDYLNLVADPSHPGGALPRTTSNGKLERYHQSIRHEVN